LVATLKELAHLCSEGQRICVAREITKVFEEFKVGTPAELAVYYASKTPRGEITLLVEGGGPREREIDRDKVVQAARELLADGLSRKDVVAKLTESLSLARNEVYRLVSSL
jgi:16S rRNA (cytidine1402-2'-O)-methyltransferase